MNAVMPNFKPNRQFRQFTPIGTQISWIAFYNRVIRVHLWKRPYRNESLLNASDILEAERLLVSRIRVE